MRHFLYPRRLTKYLFYKFTSRCRVESALVDYRARIGQGSVVREGAIVYQSKVGAYCYLNLRAAVYHTDVGDYCSLGHACHVGPNEHLLDYITTCELIYPDDVGIVEVRLKPDGKNPKPMMFLNV